MGSNRIHRILKKDYVLYIFRYDIEISHRYRHWLSLTKAIKSFKKQDKYVRKVFSDVVIRTKGKYDWRRAHHKHMKVHVALDAPASEAENMRMWSQYEVFMTAILPIPIDLCQLCFWIIRYQLISGSAPFSHESMHGSLDSSILDLEVQMEALLGWTAPWP